MASSSSNRMFGDLQIPLEEIVSATNNFSDENLIRRGGFGYTYRGQLLRFGQRIDIVARRLDRTYRQGNKEFWMEVSMLSTLKHDNLVSIIGYCDDKGEKIIVNKFETHGSLETYLRDTMTLTWMRRLEICVGVARALSYIHYDRKRDFSVIHRNIKSTKILLDDKWQPKLSGFELSMTQTAARRHRLLLDSPCGTIGYIDPIYEQTGGVTHKSDVYSFGVVLFEVLCGRRSAYDSNTSSAQMAKQQAKQESGHVLEKSDQLIVENDVEKQHSRDGFIVDDVEIQHSRDGFILDVDRDLNENIVEQEGRNSHPVAKLDEIIEHQSGSPHLTKQQQSTEDHVDGNLEDEIIENEGNQLVHPSAEGPRDVVEIMDDDDDEQVVGHDQLTKQLSLESSSNVVPKSDEIMVHRRWHSSPSTKQHSKKGSPESEREKHTSDDFVEITLDVSDMEVHILAAPYAGPLSRSASIETRFLRRLRRSASSNTARSAESNRNWSVPARPSSSGYLSHGVSSSSRLSSEMQASSPIKLSGPSSAGTCTSLIIGEEEFEIYTEQYPALNPLEVCKFTLAPSLRFHHGEEGSGLGHLMYLANQQLLAPIAIHHYEQRNLVDIIDPDLWEQMDPQSFNMFSETAYFCLKEQRSERPDIHQILTRLEKALDLQRKYEHPHPLVLKEHSVVATNHLMMKWENLEHLKIEFHDIELATHNFSEQHCIGSGGYGKVYKAELNHFDSKSSLTIEGKNKCDLPKIRSTVAIKSIFNREDTQAEEGFFAEIEMLTSCKHPNIVSLLGFCAEGPQMILVYEYVAKGSLDDYLESMKSMSNLKWEQRLKMCLDIVEGLNYLHTEKNIIHRDIKSANILLEDNWVAKIADFGFSKIGPISQQGSYLNTKVAGTSVYLDPEYEETNILRKASDIYSLGVVLFEIISGTLAYDKRYIEENPKGLAHFAQKLYLNGTIKDMLDPKLKEEFDENSFILSKGPHQQSFETFLEIAYPCLAETQAQRPEIGTVVDQLKKALHFQKNPDDKLQISLKDIKLATGNFSHNNRIGRGGFGRVYKGEVTNANGSQTTIAAKRLDRAGGQGESNFLTELEILLEYKHENIIGLVGYCNEAREKIIIYEFASKGSLDKHLSNNDLTWRKRLEICIDIATGLDFLHGGGVTQEVVMHRDIKSPNILLDDGWKAKISDFGLSLITPINKDMNYIIDNACGTKGYCDPLYAKFGYLTKESDIYSFGVLLYEVLCGRLMFENIKGRIKMLTRSYKRLYKKGKFDEMVFEGIKEQIAPKSLTKFQKLAYECLHGRRKKRPTASDLLRRLKKALEFQVDYEIWEPKLPQGYREIIQMSNFPEKYSSEKRKDLYDMFVKGILLQEDKVLFTLGANGERNKMISAKTFSFINRCLHRWHSIPESRFQDVAEMLDVLNLNIKIKTKNELLSRNVVYGIYLVFKFSDPRKNLSKPLYVNLKYRNGSKTSHAYFATWRDDEWMMIEFWRFLNDKEHITFKFILDNFSQCNYDEDSTIYVEGIEFRAINTHVKSEEIGELKKVQQVLRSDSKMDLLQQLPTNYQEILMRIDNDGGEKLISLHEVNGKRHRMLSAKATLINCCNAKLFQRRSSTQSRFSEAIELLPQQVFRISCEIERQILIRDTDYVCYLVFRLSENCQGLHGPIKVRELLHLGDKEAEIVYFRSPNPWNLHDTNHAPQQREDGLMEVKVWKFNFKHEFSDDNLHVNLRFISYEGTMSGLIVCGLEFRSM